MERLENIIWVYREEAEWLLKWNDTTNTGDEGRTQKVNASTEGKRVLYIRLRAVGVTIIVIQHGNRLSSR